MLRWKHHCLAVGGLILILTLGLGGCNTGGQFIFLTASQPVAQIADGLSISANPAQLTGEFGVRLNAVTPDDFINAPTGSALEKARMALPANFILQSAIFKIETTGTPPEQIFVSVVAPASVNAHPMELYAWDGTQWAFVPARGKGGLITANISAPPAVLAAFEIIPPPPSGFAIIEPGQSVTPEAASVLDAMLLGGVTAQANGGLAGQLPSVPPGQAYAVYPVVRDYDSTSLNTAFLQNLFNDPAVRANHLQMLVSFAANYTGLVIDYRGLPPEARAAYAGFISELAGQLHALDKKLLVKVEPPVAAGAGSFSTAGYDWRALGAAADGLVFAIADTPAAFGNGLAESVLAWATGEAPHSRLYLLTSAASVDSANGIVAPLTAAEAVSRFGSVALAAGTSNSTFTGQSITLTLSGKVQTLDYDAAAFAARYAYTDDAGAAHTVWLITSATLRQQLTLVEKHYLGGVVVADLFMPGMAGDMVNAVTQYKTAAAAAAAQTQAQLIWTVAGASGTIAQATAQPGQPYVYAAQEPGDYKFSAELQTGQTVKLGDAQVKVANVPTPTPTSQPVYVNPGGSSDNSGSPTSEVVAAPPPPVAGGSFELGGQVPGFIAHPNEMHQAGMKWVKFQALGDAGGNISGGKGAGFKVLLSAVGDKSRAADPAYWPQYAAWVAGMAAQGADAIEIWNEANLDREWPNGQINGATYTELLKQAYAAIKAANPNTMVIGGAPAPTGAAGAAGCTAAFCNDDIFLQQMAAAGAANYMDCVGVHYNTGTTSPNTDSGSALSGYHYSYYFWPMVNLYYDTFGGSRQLCFTELGYLTSEGYPPIPSGFSWAAGNSVAQQSQWLAEAASLSAGSGKVRMMIIFNVDFTHYSSDPQAGYAIVRPGGSCPACASLDAVMP